MNQVSEARRNVRWAGALALSLLPVMAVGQEGSPAPTASPQDFVAAVKATTPLAYYRLEATCGSSEGEDCGYKVRRRRGELHFVRSYPRDHLGYALNTNVLIKRWHMIVVTFDTTAGTRAILGRQACGARSQSRRSK